ncbi:membrane protein [Christiangramia forsetii]|uniref:Membrane protein n=2 Tax=Christiangramia forsetii TaxID=411153 RepID=A0M5D3_CHRFK|nr:membrane protein [Christiangramia forsetii]GGG21226.1 hypothetical protein GCM10011532_00290 [Christiangramia forsetii]CAL67828.1 membrane protein [Christiangramia forsetii KT0803]
MKYLKNTFELYINSSIHVSLAVVAFTLITFFEHDLIPDLNLLLFIFFASITGYNFVKYAGIAKLHHLSLAKNLKIIQIFSCFCFIALVYFCFQLKMEVLIATGILGAFTLFYAIPVFGGGKNLRSLPGIKIFIIALVWAGSTVLLPLINAEKFLGIELLIDFVQRILLVIILTLPFEIRDLNFDNENLGTIPQKLGSSTTKIFGTFLILIIFLVELFQESFNSAEFLALGAILFLSGLFLWQSKEDQKKYYASFWVEAVPILYLGVYLIVNFGLPQIPF